MSEALDWRALVAVLAGGGVGSLIRYLTTVTIAARLGGYPWVATLLINVVGSFAIGVVFELAEMRALGVSPLVRVLLMTGLLGGFTTFSTFSLEIVGFLNARELPLALAYVLTSVIAGFLLAYLGMVTVRAMQP